ncbi:MAG: TraR/DksA family transcriptional regulator [Patescibacteria group bacterium]
MKSSKEFIEKQKNELLKEKAKLLEQISTLSKYPDYGDIGDDNTKELEDYENNLSIENRLSKTLDKIDRALGSIEKGEYGQCRKCHEYIESGRLENMPFVDLCVTCSTKKE